MSNYNNAGVDMRLKINLVSQKRQKIDLNYQYFLEGFIYGQLQSSNYAFSTMLHDRGFKIYNKSFKLFSFSKLLPEKFIRDGSDMILNGNIKWYIGSPIKEFILYLCEALSSKTEICIGSCPLNILNLSIAKEIEFKRQMDFRCLSPVVVTTGKLIDGKIKPRSVSLDDRKFNENIKNNILKKYLLLKGTLPNDMSFDIEFKNIDKYKRGKLIKFKDTYLKGYEAPFTIIGNPELIKVAYDASLGEKNSQGMGFIDAINFK